MNRANPVPVGTEPYFKALGGAREAAMPEKRQRLTADCRFSAALEGGVQVCVGGRSNAVAYRMDMYAVKAVI